MPEFAVYTAHLASDKDRNQTACGEPWQGWQEPYDADLIRPRGAGTLPPNHPPRDATTPGGPDLIRACVACHRLAMRTPL